MLYDETDTRRHDNATAFHSVWSASAKLLDICFEKFSGKKYLKSNHNAELLIFSGNPRYSSTRLRNPICVAVRSPSSPSAYITLPLCEIYHQLTAEVSFSLSLELSIDYSINWCRFVFNNFHTNLLPLHYKSCIPINYSLYCFIDIVSGTSTK